MDPEKKSFLKLNVISLYSIGNKSFIETVFNKLLNIKLIMTLLILIGLSFIWILYKLKTYIYNNDNTYYTYLGNYSLYNIIKYPKISILILNIDQWNFHNISISDFILNLKNQSLNEIEIIFSLAKEKINLISNYSIFDNRIRIFPEKESGQFLKNFFYLIEQLNGKFTIIFNKYEALLNNNELEKMYNFTKGKINNIFKFIINKDFHLTLIKTKTLRNIEDNDLEFNNLYSLYYYIDSLSNPQLNYISIAFCLNNLYSVYAHVAMLSILDSKNYHTFITFYLVIPKDFTTKNIDFLSSIYEQYDFFNITFLRMDDRYENAFISRYLTTHAYYRLSLGELIPHLNRIIYLDPDIIALKDLSDFYNLNFNGKMILAQPTYANKSPINGIFKINSGILLLNLKLMRKIKIEEKILYLLNNGYNDDYHDQNLINHYFYNYVGIYPPKYHARPFDNYSAIKTFNSLSGNVYNTDYLYFHYKYPSIRHYLNIFKPIYNNFSLCEDWWYFARKSKYFNKITDNLTNIFNYNYK